jgi:hypothetical protein
MARMLENCVALAVTNQITLRFANRQRRRRPEVAAVFITNVYDFARRIADGVVGPGVRRFS